MRLSKTLIFPAIFALLHGALSLSVLALGYPHEDAYILFKYARNVASGFGSVFFEGGPHAEGATDFLWMMTLGGLAKLRIDPALGAALLNAMGFGLAVDRMRTLVRDAVSSPWLATAVTAVAGLLALLQPFSAAGAVGFSATLYAALALALYRALVQDDSGRVPVLALLLGLVRPDGVLLGGAATIFALTRARRAGQLRPFLTRALACAAVGAIYFVARARYFGDWLPLPLVVKSHFEGRPPGVGEFVDWSASTLGPLAFAAMVFAFLARVRAPMLAKLALMPFAVHVLGFVPTFPSQNVADRFQAPAALALFTFALCAAARALDAARLGRGRLRFGATLGIVIGTAAIVTYPQSLVSVRALRESFEPDYVNPFSVELAAIERARTDGGSARFRVAATEAGRVLYWVRGPVIDLVGLNTRETAAVAPTRALLSRFDADIVMFHHASTMNEDAMEHGRKGDVLPVDVPLASLVWPWNVQFLPPDLAPYDQLHADNVRVAPVATAAWLDEHRGEYDVYAVSFEARFARRHLYAIKKTLPERDVIVRALAESHEIARHGSHLRAIR